MDARKVGMTPDPALVNKNPYHKYPSIASTIDSGPSSWLNLPRTNISPGYISGNLNNIVTNGIPCLIIRSSVG